MTLYQPMGWLWAEHTEEHQKEPSGPRHSFSLCQQWGTFQPPALHTSITARDLRNTVTLHTDTPFIFLTPKITALERGRLPAKINSHIFQVRGSDHFLFHLRVTGANAWWKAWGFCSN